MSIREETARAGGGFWAMFDPTGVFDGGISDRRSREDAQRVFARPRRWATMEREGWMTRAVSRVEFDRLFDEQMMKMENG